MEATEVTSLSCGDDTAKNDELLGSPGRLGESLSYTSVPCAGITTGNELAVFLVGKEGQLYSRTKGSSQWTISILLSSIAEADSTCTHLLNNDYNWILK